MGATRAGHRLHGDDRECFHDAVRTASAGAGVTPCDVRIIRQDGKAARCSIELQPEVDSEGRVTALVGLVQDLTEEKRAEDALRQSQSLLRALIDAIPAAITVRDRSGRFVFVNACEAEYYGRPTEWFDGKVLADVYPADLAQRIAREAGRYLGLKQPVKRRIGLRPGDGQDDLAILRRGMSGPVQRFIAEVKRLHHLCPVDERAS